MRGRTSIFTVLVGTMLVLAAAAPVSALEGDKGNSRGSTESKTNADNNSNGSQGNSQGSPESKTNEDNNSNGSQGNSQGSPESKTNADNNSNGSPESNTNEDNSDGASEAKGDNGGKGSKGASASGSDKGGKKSPTPGNNGTIKVDGEPFDTTKNNEPHVGCTFRVLYFGTDEEEGLTSTLTFSAHAPTSGDFTVTDTVTVGADEPDIAGPYNLVAGLEAAGIEPHPQQGYHVKLTTNTEYSQGADVKHKVFWIQCDQPGTEVEGETLVNGDETVHKAPASSDEDDEVLVLGSGLSRGTEDDAADVAGAAAERGPRSRAEVAGGVLPLTGSEVTGFLLVALGLIGAGIAFMRFRRNRQSV